MNVLVIEDEAFSAMITVAFFQDEGHSVVHVTNAKDALNSIASAPPDIIISDWSIDGDISAAEIASKARATHPTVKLAFVTGHQQDRLEAELVGLEPYSFYTKPVDFEKLVKELTAEA